MTTGRVQSTNEVSEGQVDRREEVSVHREGNYEHRERIVRDVGMERRLLLDRVTQVVYLLFGILESLIGLRVVLRLMGANPENPFALSIYRFTGLFLAPFAGLIANPAADSMVLEVTSLIGMVVYVLLCWLIVRVLWLAFYRTSAHTVSTYERDHQ